jgi:hypothetical protein
MVKLWLRVFDIAASYAYRSGLDQVKPKKEMIAKVFSVLFSGQIVLNSIQIVPN